MNVISTIAGRVTALSYRRLPMVAIGLWAVLVPETALAQTTYPMLCRAGGRMKLIVAPVRGEDRTRIEILFRKAAIAGGTRLPGPGECAWVDRPVNSSEPSTIEYRLRAFVWVEFEAASGSSRVHTGVAASSSDRDMAFTRELLRVVRSGNCFMIRAYNTNRGYFIATRSLTAGC